MLDQALLDAATGLRELIESHADETESNCTMAKPVVEAIDATGLFRLSVPRELGGIEASVETIASVCEELSYADGATGWAFIQNTISGSYLSYLDPENAKKFAAMRTGAGHFAPLGQAHEEDGGYRISGKSAVGRRDFGAWVKFWKHVGSTAQFAPFDAIHVEVAA